MSFTSLIVEYTVLLFSTRVFLCVRACSSVIHSFLPNILDTSTIRSKGSAYLNGPNIAKIPKELQKLYDFRCESTDMLSGFRSMRRTLVNLQIIL